MISDREAFAAKFAKEQSRFNKDQRKNREVLQDPNFLQSLQYIGHPLFVILSSMSLPNADTERSQTFFKVGACTVEIRQFVYPGPFFAIEPDKTKSESQRTIVRPGYICIIHITDLPQGNIASLRQEIKSNLIEICNIIKGETPHPDLKLTPEKALRLSYAGIYGISHLVGILDRKLSGCTWSLTGLDQRAQDLFTADSQAVSNAFGGTRIVQSDDIQVLCVSPDELRNILQQSG